MQRLREIIKTLNGKPVSKYACLCGRYTRDKIVFYIRNITGGQIKYCSVNISIPTKTLFHEYNYCNEDDVPAAYYLSKEFEVIARISNDEMAQNEANIEKGFFIAYSCGQKVIPNNSVKLTNEYITF